MKQKELNLPAFTKKDIIVLRGHPAAKMMKSCSNSASAQSEEWVYYNLNTNSKDRYLFKNERLSGWIKE
jgi:hypothetical protein